MKPGLQILFQTRYSFFGLSGWRSQDSQDMARLFDPARLAQRFDLFQRLNLASLRDQTDADFKLVLLTSTELPEDHARLVTEACHDMIGEERTHIIARPPGRAGAWLQKHISRKLNDISHSAQIVLDDDDAVSADFVALCRAEAGFALSRLRPDQEAAYLSFADGLTGLFREDGGVDLAPRSAPFTNLGLTLVAPTATRKNPYLLAHKKVARRHQVRVLHDQRPFYIRAVHDTNDSRAQYRDEILGADAIKAALPYFPLLMDLDLIKLRDSNTAVA
ncbi:glycosyltransferase [Aestuariivita sp.]|jgi:hypothetical protein|uniref:glycosyltransferase n=1 Tax=Aestuariivita sp. TaxID=1872407 RepID=UPI00216FF42F|nr:glycosyltransferase [Aestuariivita sp.]MCE8008935.1 hypothetical protein [Aestuariivita sp.]